MKRQRSPASYSYQPVAPATPTWCQTAQINASTATWSPTAQRARNAAIMTGIWK